MSRIRIVAIGVDRRYIGNRNEKRQKKRTREKNEWRERMNENIEEELVQCKKIKVNKVIQNLFMVSPKKSKKIDFIRTIFREIDLKLW